MLQLPSVVKLAAFTWTSQEHFFFFLLFHGPKSHLAREKDFFEEGTRYARVRPSLTSLFFDRPLSRQMSFSKRLCLRPWSLNVSIHANQLNRSGAKCSRFLFFYYIYIYKVVNLGNGEEDLATASTSSACIVWANYRPLFRTFVRNFSAIGSRIGMRSQRVWVAGRSAVVRIWDELSLSSSAGRDRISEGCC
jgi:hypothetical protein